MSLRPQANYDVPEETIRVAWAAFPKGHPYMHLHDTFGCLFEEVLHLRMTLLANSSSC